MRLLSRLVAAAFGIVVVVFAIANRSPVEVSFDPLPFVFGLPLYGVVIGALIIGFAAGAAVAWLGGHAARDLARVRKARIQALEGDVARLRAAAADPSWDGERLPPPADAA